MAQAVAYVPKHFSVERFQKHQVEVRLRMSDFLLKYLSRLYQEFDGDLAMAIILGEIAHHNLSAFYSASHVDRASLSEILRNPELIKHMQVCNAFSISEATGIPRETVRRKVKELVDRGFVERRKCNGLCIVSTIGERFSIDIFLQNLDGLLETSQALGALMATPSQGHDARKASS